ncbi:MAG: FAD-dependent oxidoreductase, partial [Treponema sp.]|nr:FAD-dependent oxidoreductase [Treponema sp.]
MMIRESIKTDVAIFGAGPGGLGAAIAAAREGAKVLLVERMGYLGGGMATGLPFLAFFDMHKRRIIGGIANEIVERLKTLSGENPVWPDGSVEGTSGHRYCPMHISTTTVNQFYTRILFFQWAKELGIRLMLHCETAGAAVENGRLKMVSVVGKGKAFDIEAKVFIDGTGDGDLGYLAGASFEKGAEGTGLLQPPTLMFNLSGVDFDRFIDYLEEHPEEPIRNTEGGFSHIRPGYDAQFFRNHPGHIFVGLQETIKRLRQEGKCPIDRDSIIYIRQPIPGTVAVNTIRIKNFDGSDVYDLTRGEQDAHLQILPLIKMFREYVPG